MEDDASVRRAATRVLERFGYTVVPAEDGMHALAIMDTLEPTPDLIISDIVMPRASGSQLLSALHDAGLTPRILFTSGYTARDSSDRAALDPSLPFLPKPWTITDLLRKVREVLDEPVVVGSRERGPAARPADSPT